MIRQSFYLEDWDWYVIVYYAIDTYYIEDILGDLEAIGCLDEELTKAENNLMKKYDVGLTYSNLTNRCSVIVIGLTSSSAEFQNTWDHEKGHLAMHISKASNIDPFGEEFQYLTGEIGMQMFTVAKRFLCDHCRKDFIKGVE